MLVSKCTEIVVPNEAMITKSYALTGNIESEENAAKMISQADAAKKQEDAEGEALEALKKGNVEINCFW